MQPLQSDGTKKNLIYNFLASKNMHYIANIPKKTGHVMLKVKLEMLKDLYVPTQPTQSIVKDSFSVFKVCSKSLLPFSCECCHIKGANLLTVILLRCFGK